MQRRAIDAPVRSEPDEEPSGLLDLTAALREPAAKARASR